MKHIKIIAAVSIVFIALIIAVFWPALKSGDEGYNTKTVVEQPTEQADLTTEEVAPEEVIDTAPVDVPEEIVAEEQAPPVTMVEEKAEEAVVPAEPMVTEPIVTDEAAAEPEVTEQPVIPPTEVVTPTAEPATSSAENGLYSVVDGNKLDANSYAGFKLFRNWCARCHGTYGQGMVGPDLAESLKFISKEQFYDTVENGKTGTIGSMPSWKANVEVMANRDKLYAYLKARSDGAIGVEKPQKQ